MSSRPKAISLFTGAGGLDLGVEAAGFDVVYAVEREPIAVQTLNENSSTYFPSLAPVEPSDITRTDPHDVLERVGLRPGDVALLVGGPPCVAFSKSGFHLEYKREGRDPRAGLLDDYLRFLDVLRPETFIMENVFGLAYRNQSAAFLNRLREGVRELGYSFSQAVLNAADFGVPQNRQRLFLLGSRDGRVLEHPQPTHWGPHEGRRTPTNASRLLPHVTTREAFLSLQTTPEPDEVVDGKWGHLLADIPPGGNYLFYTEHMGHPEPLFDWRSRYWTFLLKLDPNRPSSTLQGQPGPYVGPFHWENRRLRVPELKRLHGFPDDFQLAGNRRDIQLQIGNAVPPVLAQAVAAAVTEQAFGGSCSEAEALHSRDRQLALSV